MKIKKFNDNLNTSYKLYICQVENTIPCEIHEYKNIDDVISDYSEYIKTGFNFNIANSNKLSRPFNGGLPKIYDSYIVKITREKIDDEEFQSRLNSKKYNI